MRFGIEAAFLLIVAAGAALARLSPARIILLMFVAWVLVALIERASARPRARPVAWQMASEDEPAERRWSWRGRRQAPEAPQEDEAAPAPVEPEPAAEPEAIEAVDETPSPAVTKRALDLPGLEEPEAEVPPDPEPEPQLEPEPEPEPEPVAVEEPPPPAPPAPPAVEQPPAPREWNLWELERQARAHAGYEARDEEWTALFVYLRQFATTEGLLPKEFDGLVRESFGELIQAA